LFRLQANGTAPAMQPQSGGESQNPRSSVLPATGPTEPLRARVLVVGREIPVVVLDRGSAHGVQPGWRFEIVRNDRRVAVVEVERDITEDGSKCRARFIEGEARDVLEGDRAIAFVQGLPGSPVPASAPQPASWRITGTVSDGYIVNAGRGAGVQPGDLLFVYRGGVQRATLRAEYAAADWCMARPADGYPQEPIFEGDEVRLRELPRVVAGRVRLVRDGRAYVDVGTRAGVYTGMRMRVSRLGREVGKIVIEDAREFFSIARPEGEIQGGLQKDDFLQPAPDGP
jgi:hypothetical protein